MRTFLLKIRLICTLALLVLASTLPAQVGTPLRIGFAINYAPFSEQSDGVPSGLLVDLATHVASSLDRPLQMAFQDWESLEASLQAAEIDCIFGLYFSESRSKTYTFGAPLHTNISNYYARNGGGGPRSLDAANKTRIGVTGDQSLITRFAKNNYQNVDWVVFPDWDALAVALKADESIAGFVEEAILAEPLLTRGEPAFPFTLAEGPILTRAIRPVALKSNETLIQDINQALRSLSPSDRNTLHLRWLGTPSSISRSLTLEPHEEAYLKALPPIRFASDPAWPPIAFRDANNKQTGMQIDFLHLIEEKLGIHFQFPPFYSWPAVQSAIEDGQADMRSGSLGEPRSTQTYFEVPIALVVNNNSNHGYNLSSFTEKRISVEDGNPFAETLKSRYPQIEFILVPTELAGLEKLINRETDGHVGNLAVCAHLIQNKYTSALSIIDTIDEIHQLAFTLSDDPAWKPLIPLLDRAIADISPIERQNIYDRWISVNVNKVRDIGQYIWALSIAALCIGLATLWRINTVKLKSALVKAEERLLIANKVGSGGQFEWYPSKNKATFSREFFEILGYNPNDIKTDLKSVANLIYPSDLKRMIAAQRRATKTGKAYEYTVRMRRFDGAWAWVLMRGAPTQYDENGAVTRYIGTQSDITKIRQTSDELKRQKEIARQANRAKSDFLAKMSHEIRTPMNAILGFSRLLKREQSLTLQQREFVHLINKAGEHLLSLINDVLDMAKIEAGRMQARQKPYALKSLLEDVSKIFAGRCHEAQIAFYSHIDETLPDNVAGDSTKLRQIIFNLLGNSLKFTKSGSIDFRATSVLNGSKTHLEITIADTGSGISKEDKKKLFKAFSQGDSGKTREGTGLGLTITKELLEMMNGTISLESTENKGTTFSLSIPLKPTDDDLAPSYDSEVSLWIPPSATENMSILIVDDRLYSLQYLQRFLSEFGFAISLAKDGVEALEKWKKHSPDLIILDLRMPRKNGFEVMEQIRGDKVNSQPLILVLTASALNSQSSRAFKSGANSFMSKPFDENELVEEIAKLLSLTAEPRPNQTKPAPPTLAPKASLKLSVSHTAILRKACLGGYVEEIDKVIALVAENEPATADRLRLLAHNFDYHRIKELLDQNE